MTAIQMFQVGGCVRDHLLGLKSKDIDFVVIAPSFEAMEQHVRSVCTKVFEDKDGVPVGAEFHTLRGIHPTLGAVDFVWARIDGPSSDGRHPDWVKPGSLDDDQNRRDFRCNSIAMTEDGTLIDPHNGAEDIANGVLRFVGRAEDRLREDALRALRGVRFQITKGFKLDDESASAIRALGLSDFDAVSGERIREELSKCFATDTPATMEMLRDFPNIFELAIERGLWFKPTFEAR